MRREELMAMSSELVRKEASKAGVKNYTKFKKAELVEMILEAESQVQSEEEVKEEVKEEECTALMIIPQPEEEVKEEVKEEAPKAEPKKESKPKAKKEEVELIVPEEAIASTKAQTVRNLFELGWERKNIAKALGLRYQHVREIHIKMVKDQEEQA